MVPKKHPLMFSIHYWNNTVEHNNWKQMSFRLSSMVHGTYYWQGVFVGKSVVMIFLLDNAQIQTVFWHNVCQSTMQWLCVCVCVRVHVCVWKRDRDGVGMSWVISGVETWRLTLIAHSSCVVCGCTPTGPLFLSSSFLLSLPWSPLSFSFLLSLPLSCFLCIFLYFLLLYTLPCLVCRCSLSVPPSLYLFFSFHPSLLISLSLFILLSFIPLILTVPLSIRSTHLPISLHFDLILLSSPRSYLSLYISL